MADRKSKGRTIELEYRYDRLVATKLEQVYQLLVPNKLWSNGAADVKNEVKEGVAGYENCSNLRTRVLGAAKRRTHRG